MRFEELRNAVIHSRMIMMIQIMTMTIMTMMIMMTTMTITEHRLREETQIIIVKRM